MQYVVERHSLGTCTFIGGEGVDMFLGSKGDKLESVEREYLAASCVTLSFVWSVKET